MCLCSGTYVPQYTLESTRRPSWSRCDFIEIITLQSSYFTWFTRTHTRTARTNEPAHFAFALSAIIPNYRNNGIVDADGFSSLSLSRSSLLSSQFAMCFLLAIVSISIIDIAFLVLLLLLLYERCWCQWFWFNVYSALCVCGARALRVRSVFR